MLLSVCIVNWNTRDYLRECLTALYAHPPQDDALEVIVVDNASVDGSADMVQAEFPQVILAASPKNLGYAQGNNEALKRAAGDWLLLLNPDVVVHPESLTNAVRCGQTHPEAGAIGGRLIGTDGQTQRSLRSFPDPGPVIYEYLGLSRLFPRSRVFGAYRMTYFDYDRAGEADQPMGSFLLIPRRAFDAVGLMDPQFPIFFNEVDWCWRAKREHGFPIYYTPEVVVTHYGGGSTRQAKARMIHESHRSLLRFYEKHYKQHIAAPLYWLIGQAVLGNERRLIRAADKRERHG
jgi:N-acetylglucosaminyl-diphospho-decaprenol L-rhamnosyltransferase